MKREEFERQFKGIIENPFAVVVVKGRGFTFNADDYYIGLNYVYFWYCNVFVGYTTLKSILKVY